VQGVTQGALERIAGHRDQAGARHARRLLHVAAERQTAFLDWVRPPKSESQMSLMRSTTRRWLLWFISSFGVAQALSSRANLAAGSAAAGRAALVLESALNNCRGLVGIL
jgi:hypothetical protein